MANNRPALALHEKMGFVVEGMRRGSMLIEGTYVDEHCMAKLLD